MRLLPVALVLVALALAVGWCTRLPRLPPTSESLHPNPAQAAPIRVAPDAEDRREPVAQRTEKPATKPGVEFEVRVVDWVTHDPVAGAELRWMRADDWARRGTGSAANKRREHEDPQELARAFGRHARTDPRGIARIRIDCDYTDVYARQADRVGASRLSVRDEDARATIEVSRRHDLAVLVVGPSGRPFPGVPVELVIAGSGTARDTDPQGIASIRYSESWVGRDRSGVPRTANVVVRVASPGLRECSTTFPATSPPAGTLKLTLPATGALHVRLVHPGRQIEKPQARLWIAPSGDRGKPEQEWQREPDADGVFRFCPVPLATKFDLKVTISNLVLPHSVVGPTHIDQVVETEVAIPADAIAVAGRVVDAAGQPIAHEHMWLRCNLPHPRYGLHTDANGRFLWHSSRAGTSNPEMTQFTLSLRNGGFDGVLFGNAAGRTLRPGCNDLGEIRLVQPPRVVGGWLVFTPPEARRQVRVAVEVWGEGVGPDSAAGWQEVRQDLYVFQHEGRFVVRGTPPRGRLRLTFGKDAAPVEFASGGDDIRVEIAQKGR